MTLDGDFIEDLIPNRVHADKDGEAYAICLVGIEMFNEMVGVTCI